MHLSVLLLHPSHSKEALWPYVREFSDRAISHIDGMLQQLRTNMTPCELYAVHGHYADAGEAAALIASTMDADMLMTGHSLGRNKLEHLRASGRVCVGVGCFSRGVCFCGCVQLFHCRRSASGLLAGRVCDAQYTCVCCCVYMHAYALYTDMNHNCTRVKRACGTTPKTPHPQVHVHINTKCATNNPPNNPPANPLPIRHDDPLRN